MVVAATVVAIAVPLALANIDWNRVHTPAKVVGCKTEDSCSINYRDGAWYIRVR